MVNRPVVQVEDFTCTQIGLGLDLYDRELKSILSPSVLWVFVEVFLSCSLC